MMTRYSFKVGEFFMLDQSAYQIERVIGEKIHVIAVSDGATNVHELHHLLEKFAGGALRFLAAADLSEAERESADVSSIERGLADFPEVVRRNALIKWKFLNALCPEGRLRCTREAVKAMLHEVWGRLDPAVRGDKPPSLASFYRWRSKWVWAKRDVRALIDKWGLRGRRPARLPDKLSELIDEGLQRVYLTPQRESLRETIDTIQSEVDKENLRRTDEDMLPEVTTRMVNRVLSNIDRFRVLKARYGERYARGATRIYGAASTCTRPLERVEVDHTPLDILVIDSATNLPLGRPWITVMLDAYSRMIVGVHISFRRPSTLSVLRCLKHSILPKTYIKNRFPKIVGNWDTYGLIEQLICDNGLEFHAQDLEAACAQLGIHVIYCPTRAPQMKGRIERFLKTLNYGLIHLQPGTTFSTYEKREAYDSTANAALTLESLSEIVHRWIVDVYPNTFHRGIQCTPKEKWDDAINDLQRRLPPSMDAIQAYLGISATRRLSKNGIEIHSMRYTSPLLEDLRSRRGDIEVVVRTDPDDLGKIYVLDEEKHLYIEALSTYPDYAMGLTAEQHRWMRSKARSDYKGSSLRQGLLAAKADLREYTLKVIQHHQQPTKRGKRSKLQIAEKEAMVQREEIRMGRREEAPYADDIVDPPENIENIEKEEIPLFHVRRGAFPSTLPKT